MTKTIRREILIPQPREQAKALHLTGPAWRLFEASRFLQPARQVNAFVWRRVIVVARQVGMTQMDDYRNRLAAAKERYPFRKWAEWGIEQHTHQALNLFVAVFNQLIETLTALGQPAPESDKIAAIRPAVETLNALNEKNEILIETDEREDLCKLFNIITTAADIDASKYADGEGPASEWRDW